MVPGPRLGSEMAAHLLLVLLGAVTDSSALTAAFAARAGDGSCQLYYNATTVGVPGVTCWKWDLSKVPAHTWVGHGGTSGKDNDGTWAIANPCGTASPVVAGCTEGASADAVAYEIVSSDPVAGTKCVPVGNAHDAAFTPYGSTIDAGSGVHVEYYGKLGSFAYDAICSDNQQGGPDFGNGIGPPANQTTRSSPATVVWLDKGFCPTKQPGPCPPSLPPAPAPPLPPSPPPPPAPPWGTVPVPTRPQLDYYDSEIRALIHFNMATFIEDGDPGCTADNWNKKQPYATGPSSDPATFNPLLLDFNNWMNSFKSLGVRDAVMTAKHGCGFLLWPTDTKLPNGSPYDYCVGKERSAVKYVSEDGAQRPSVRAVRDVPSGALTWLKFIDCGIGCTCRYDLIGNFAKSMAEGGVKIGFYYSLTNNFFMNVVGKVAKGSEGWLPGMAVSAIFIAMSHCVQHLFACGGCGDHVCYRTACFNAYCCRRMSPRQNLSASQWTSSLSSGHDTAISQRYG